MDAVKRMMGALANWLRLRGKRVNRFLQQIHLVDKCLLLLMAMLLAQSGHVLMTNTGEGATANHVDVIIRTSSASIFGYFLSANFVQRSSSEEGAVGVIRPTKELLNQSAQGRGTPQNRIGFSLAQGDDEAQGGPAGPQQGQEPVKAGASAAISRLQIITATGIAVFCLVALILMRNVAGEGQINTSTAAVMAQFRDFVSGSVGFLIGCPTGKGK